MCRMAEWLRNFTDGNEQSHSSVSAVRTSDKNIAPREDVDIKPEFVVNSPFGGWSNTCQSVKSTKDSTHK